MIFCAAHVLSAVRLRAFFFITFFDDDLADNDHQGPNISRKKRALPNPLFGIMSVCVAPVTVMLELAVQATESMRLVVLWRIPILPMGRFAKPNWSLPPRRDNRVMRTGDISS